MKASGAGWLSLGRRPGDGLVEGDAVGISAEGCGMEISSVSSLSAVWGEDSLAFLCRRQCSSVDKKYAMAAVAVAEVSCGMDSPPKVCAQRT